MILWARGRRSLRVTPPQRRRASAGLAGASGNSKICRSRLRVGRKTRQVKERIKRWLFALLGKDAEAVVVSFRSGPDALTDAMCEEIRRLEPSRRHFSVASGESYWELRRRFRRYRIGLAPVLFTNDTSYRPLRRAAFLL